MYNTCVRSGFSKFWHKFQDVTAPHGEIICRIVNKSRQTLSLPYKRNFTEMLDAH
jgi:hypothetical protein